MDDSATATATATATAAGVSFRTPARILIPKLVRGREGWKARANARKKKLKAAVIRIRDLGDSRQKWKDRCQTAEAETLELKARLEQREQELVDARAEIAQLLDAKKKSSSLR